MSLTAIKYRTEKELYKKIARPFFFLFDPELMHNVFIRVGSMLGSKKITKFLTSLAFNYENPRLQQNLLGLKFKNPVGLAAGFDKNGEMISIMEDVGFGFVEAGSVTASPCAGNPGKRFERLVKQNTLWVHFGLNNKGAVKNYSRIKNEILKSPLFISVAKTNSKETTEEKAGIADYLFTLKTFRVKADAFVLNISCPNAHGGCSFSESSSFEKLAKEVYKLKLKQPILVKISPDLTNKELDKIILLSAKYNFAGFICTNLSKKHQFSRGGLSGKSIERRSNEVLRYVYEKSRKVKKKGNKFIIIGVGGIFNAEDAYKKIKLGADLVQLITGMIYEGPQLIGEINHDLVRLLNKDGYKNVREAVGKGI